MGGGGGGERRGENIVIGIVVIFEVRISNYCILDGACNSHSCAFPIQAGERGGGDSDDFPIKKSDSGTFAQRLDGGEGNKFGLITEDEDFLCLPFSVQRARTALSCRKGSIQFCTVAGTTVHMPSSSRIKSSEKLETPIAPTVPSEYIFSRCRQASCHGVGLIFFPHKKPRAKDM